MAFCQNCGAEVQGNFCPNCGTQVGAAGNNQNNANQGNQSIVYNNAVVKGRYGVGSLLLAGYGFTFLIAIVLISFSMLLLGGAGEFFELLPALLAFVLAGLVIGGLFSLPGILSIRKKTPKGLILKTTVSFIVRSVLFLPAWGISIGFCVFILGIVLRVWRIGLAVSKPKDNEYTAFVDGEKIPVTRLVDWEYSTPNRVRYMYVDDNGVYYRPAI